MITEWTVRNLYDTDRESDLNSFDSVMWTRDPGTNYSD